MAMCHFKSTSNHTSARPQVLGRTAFTLIELLTVIGIISIMLGLTLVAVQRVRDGAARVKCVNNIRQLALALHQYHDTYKAFPPGISVGANEPMPFLGWPARILPFIEREPLWETIVEAYRQDRNVGNVPPHGERWTIVSTFGCPSDSRVSSHEFGSKTSAFTSYLGVTGRDQFTYSGALYANSRVAIRDITDGTSTTLLLGERPPSADGVWGWWYAGVGHDQEGTAEMIMGVREHNRRYFDCPFDQPYDFKPGAIMNRCDMFHYWSVHSGGAHFALADGSASFFRYSANPIMPALASIAGAETIEQP